MKNNTKNAAKVPKGYKPVYTTVEVTTRTTYDKPYKMSKEPKPTKSKEYVQPVRIVNPKKVKKNATKKG